MSTPPVGTGGHHLSLWRAAHLVGVSRAELQQQVRAGRLALHDGQVSTEGLLALYPHTRLEDSGLLEDVTRLREQAFGRRVRERLLPSQEVLAQRLFHQAQELADVRKLVQRYHTVLMDVRAQIHAQAAAAPADSGWQALRAQVDAGFAQALSTKPADALTVMDDMLKVMNAQVKVRPSGHEFRVEGHDSLLQAGLKAGLRLNYGCGNGSCGMCKVRLVEGEVARTGACDYPLSQAERAQGYLLACAHTAASSEVTLELLEAQGPQDIPQQQLVAQLRSARALDTHTWELHLQTPRSHRLRFLAGQWVELGLQSPVGAEVLAHLALASCPCDDRNLLFFVQGTNEGGGLNGGNGDAMFALLQAETLRPGHAVSVRGPWGDFVLHDVTRPLVFVACDQGFAPIKSLIEHALALDDAAPLSLFWLSTRAAGHFLANQCRAWSQALDHVETELLHCTDLQQGVTEVCAALRADLFAPDCAFYLAGPAPFMESVLLALRAEGVPASQIHCAEVLAHPQVRP